ncbi:unnamed protein product [Heligmosomoides polygyrus]|uniref:MICOS complex subunit MIC60 n=1 Tax=Heligmosomoides polygyrus TaxID=6339 RepID=A0A3P7ZV03_HELPZ|nr:unnamed protein product [Heligmosomoides polygyrus]
MILGPAIGRLWRVGSARQPGAHQDSLPLLQPRAVERLLPPAVNHTTYNVRRHGREIDRIIKEDEQEKSRMAKLQQELAQLREQVQAMAQQNTLQVKLETTAIPAHVLKLTQLPEQVADALRESETSAPEGAIQEWEKLLEPGCEAVLSVLPLLSETALKVERKVADANKKHHEELSAVFAQAIHDDMSMRALSKLLDVESTRVVDTVKKPN